MAWNSLPAAVRHADSLHSFKRRLKSHFLACVLMIEPYVMVTKKESLYSVSDDVISPCVYVGALETSTSLMRVSTRVEHPMKADSPNKPLSSLFTVCPSVCLSVCLSHVFIIVFHTRPGYYLDG